MIVFEQGDSRVLINQTDHAHFCGELLSLWRQDGLPENPRREEVLFAARHHDNGWREEDAAPHFDPTTGAPHTFLSLPPQHRADLWRRGVARYREQRPYAALLIFEHALALHRGVASSPPYDALVAELSGCRRELIEELGVDAEDLRRDYAFIGLADLVSLVACSGLSGPRECNGRRFWLEEQTLILEPLPLVGRTRFRIPCRRIEGTAVRGAAELAAVIGGARWQHLELFVDSGA